MTDQPRRAQWPGYVAIWLGIIGLAVVGFMLLNDKASTPAATSRPIWTQPPGDGAPALSLEKQMTIDVTGCTDSGGSGTVRNGSSVTVDVFIDLQYLDSSGTVVDNGLASVQGLRAGETGQWSDQRIDESDIARCRANVGNVFEQ